MTFQGTCVTIAHYNQLNMSLQEGPKEFVRCPKTEATRMWLQCPSPETAKELAEGFTETARGEGLLIEAVGDRIIVSAGTNPFAQANTKGIFMFANPGMVVYEKEI